MERVASFLLILIIYFFGTLAIVLQVIRPQRQLIEDHRGKNKYGATNYLKIILLSFILALLTTILAYWLFI